MYSPSEVGGKGGAGRGVGYEITQYKPSSPVKLSSAVKSEKHLLGARHGTNTTVVRK